MEGTIENSGNTYWWWAGPANDGAKEGFCVHCRNDDFGITKYIDRSPDEASARSDAEQLIPKLKGL